MPSPFVIANGTQFELNDERFFVTGVNSYFLAFCSDETRRSVLATVKEMGGKVVRCCAFHDVDQYTPQTPAFQYSQDGRIVVNDSPTGLQRLDAVIKAAEDFDLKLILPLVNHWTDFGGMPQYVKWLSPGSDVTEFYRSAMIREAYQNWLEQVLTRRNSITGRLYSDEPSIMAWELTNEARCPTSGGCELLLNWVNDMAAFVKARDRNHLLALGDEGYFNHVLLHIFDSNYNGTHGVDWAANLAVPDIDFGTYHFYPQVLGKSPDFATQWIKDHYKTAAALNKPVIMEEFGLKLEGDVNTPEIRNQWFAKWMATIQGTGTAGSLLWMLGSKAADAKDMVDSYAIFYANEVPDLFKRVFGAGQ